MLALDEALGDAQHKRVAIGHFNVADLVALKAVTAAARVNELGRLARSVAMATQRPVTRS